MNNLNIDTWKEQQLLNAEERIKELERENKELRDELHHISPFKSWNKIKSSIDDASYSIPVIQNAYEKYKIIAAISTVIRMTFNLNQVTRLLEKDYEKAQEITDDILNFMKENNVKN